MNPEALAGVLGRVARRPRPPAVHLLAAMEHATHVVRAWRDVDLSVHNANRQAAIEGLGIQLN